MQEMYLLVHEIKTPGSRKTLSPKELEKQFATIENAAGDAPPDFRDNLKWAEDMKKQLKIVN
jgi:hypothetical protein